MNTKESEMMWSWPNWKYFTRIWLYQLRQTKKDPMAVGDLAQVEMRY